MRLSGVMRFDALTKIGTQILQEIERRNHKGITFSFGPAPGHAIIQWDSSASLPDIAHIIELIGSNRELLGT